MAAESKQIQRLREVCAAALEIPPTMSVADWPERYRVLSSEASAAGGRKWIHRPFQREVHDALSPTHPAEIVVLMCASQMVKTEVLLNWAGYVIHQAPGPMLLVEPREQDAATLSTDRLAPMIRDTPELRELVSASKGRDSDNTQLHKKFPGGHITLTGAISPSGLAMRPIRYLALDEVDRYPLESGREGNPIALAIRRTDEFRYSRKILIASSPTVEGESAIESWFLRSNQNMPYVPCPDCGEFQVLEFERLEWPEGEPAKAGYRCSHCEVLIPQSRKSWMLEHGEFRAHNPTSRIAGFWLNKLYSVRMSWGDLAEECVLARSHGTESWKSFWNTALARTWKEQATARLEPHALLARVENYGPEAPDGVALVTAGVDVQQDRLEVEIAGWGSEEESWSLAYHVIPGDTVRGEVWAQLDELLREEIATESGVALRVAAVCVDTGFATAAVEGYVRDRFNRRVWGIKGKDGPRRLWPQKPSRSKRGTPIFIIGTDPAKSALYERFRLTAQATSSGGPGYCHFPASRDAEYFAQLTVEKQYTKYRNGFAQRYWKKPDGARNEALDCRVYAYAALHGLYAAGRNLNREADRVKRVAAANRERRELVLASAPQSPMSTKQPASPRDALRPVTSDDPWMRD